MTISDDNKLSIDKLIGTSFKVNAAADAAQREVSVLEFV